MNFFVHPIPLLAVALMAFNDHWLKYQFPGFLTGKISDFCGVFYFPIFILALFKFSASLFSKGEKSQQELSLLNILMAIVFTDFLMILVKLSPASARGIEQIFATYLFPIQIVQDWTDLFALAMNPVTYLFLKPYFKKELELKG